MKGQLTLVLEMKMKLEFIQVNPDGRSRILDHFYTPIPVVLGIILRVMDSPKII